VFLKLLLGQCLRAILICCSGLINFPSSIKQNVLSILHSITWLPNIEPGRLECRTPAKTGAGAKGGAEEVDADDEDDGLASEGDDDDSWLVDMVSTFWPASLFKHHCKERVTRQNLVKIQKISNACLKQHVGLEIAAAMAIILQTCLHFKAAAS
jgi:hypothetical protein